MDKNKVLEIAFKTIKDSTDWGIEREDKTYGYWIDGVVAMTESVLDEFENCDSVIQNPDYDNI